MIEKLQWTHVVHADGESISNYGRTWCGFDENVVMDWKQGIYLEKCLEEILYPE